MDLIIDASSIINLANGNQLTTACQLQGYQFWLSPNVLNECGPRNAGVLSALLGDKRIRKFNADLIDADEYLTLLAQYELGAGETECIVICRRNNIDLCCDDGRARRIASELIGEDRVVGSLRVLKWCVGEGLITAEAAFDCYQHMKTAGGFLPSVELRWFE